MHLTRRQFGSGLFGSLAGVSALSGSTPKVGGVRLALQSACFTFSGMNLDGILDTMPKLGLGEIDIMSEHVENWLGAPVQLPGTGRQGPWARRPDAASAGAPPRPPGGFRPDPAVREAQRKWRLAADLDRFREVKKRFDDRGLKLFSYNLSFNDSFSDEEIDKGFLMTKALGTRIITASSPASIFPRLAPFAERHDVIVAMHNHTTGPEEFAQAMQASPKFWVNLDVGHFFASGYDPLRYLEDHHARITNIHVKDRKKDRGPEMPFGQGDTPLREVLKLVQRNNYDFPVCVEYVGPDGPLVEIKRCLDYCKSVIA